MRLILVGCEYAGKTTLVNGIVKWLQSTMGGRPAGLHDHFTIPEIGHRQFSDEERGQILALSPALKEEFMRYMIEYHHRPVFYRSYADHLMVGFHIEEAVYGPMYWGYGRKGEYSERTRLAREIEKDILEDAPDTVLILVKASPEVIARRMRESPQPHGVLQEKDVEHVVQMFEEQYADSLIRHRQFVIDTSSATVEETLAQFVEQIQPYITDTDRLRMMTHRASKAGTTG